MMSRSWGMESAELIDTRRCEPLSRPFEYHAFSARSLREISRVRACWMRSAAGARCATRARKSSRSMNQPSSLSTAVTVAVQVPRSMSAVSPNSAPAENVATVSF